VDEAAEAAGAAAVEAADDDPPAAVAFDLDEHAAFSSTAATQAIAALDFMMGLLLFDFMPKKPLCSKSWWPVIKLAICLELPITGTTSERFPLQTHNGVPS
jgi:hypothetical protein